MALLVLSSCQDILEVPDISNKNIELLAPKDSTTVLHNNVSFTWTEILEADTYSVQIATPNFNNAAQIEFDTILRVDSTFIRTGIIQNLPDSDYEWRVKALNSGYETNYSSSVFTVKSSN
ncbi:hypothetical protein [Zobellia sp. OII3]|uniref:hypothetical protein n=1 Tax=Zobellia sp. OII3 TaxID=2034520 RepID=UPI000F516C89|nr:hypothetical protein [Zobellia sp. OII3]